MPVNQASGHTSVYHNYREVNILFPSSLSKRSPASMTVNNVWESLILPNGPPLSDDHQDKNYNYKSRVNLRGLYGGEPSSMEQALLLPNSETDHP